jgi:hypothetical protein
MLVKSIVAGSAARPRMSDRPVVAPTRGARSLAPRFDLIYA